MDFDTTNRPSAGGATTVCISCKERKQKCDKAQPSCSRCEKLLLRCRYPTLPHSASPSQSSNGSNGAPTGPDHEPFEDNGPLIQGLTSAAADGRAYHEQVSSLIKNHRRQFEEMVETFFISCHKWVPIVHQGSFQERCNAPQPDTPQELAALIMSMCLLTRPFKIRGKPEPLRISVYMASKRLFWDSESMARPTLGLIQSGVILSTYEYGQGLFDAAYLTISVCLSMAQVSILGKLPACHQQSLPLPGSWAPEDESLRTWWAILIHERMISLKIGILIRPLDIKTPDIMDDLLLGPKIEDPLSISFYFEAQAANFLDQVLGLIRNPNTSSPEGRSIFQSLDRSLLKNLKCLIEYGIGSCCEAVAISICAFINLHQWRLSATNSISHLQDRLESSGAIETAIRIIAETGTSLGPASDRKTYCQSAYSIEMIYQLLVQLRRLKKNGNSSFDTGSKALEMLLENQKARWKSAGDYLAMFAECDKGENDAKDWE